MDSRSFKMELPPELPTWFVMLGSAVIGAVATIVAAVFASRSASQKSKTDRELGMTNAQREWVQMQIESMRSEITGNRTHYESVIATLHQEHRAELDKQEKHCQSRLDILTRQVMTLTAQLKAYSIDLRKAGICIQPQEFGKENGSP